jgi:hypothetical protein
MKSDHGKRPSSMVHDVNQPLDMCNTDATNHTYMGIK